MLPDMLERGRQIWLIWTSPQYLERNLIVMEMGKGGETSSSP